MVKQIHAETLIKLGVSVTKVRKDVGCSRNIYYNYKQNIHLYDRSCAPSVSRLGPSLFTKEMQEVVILILW